MDLSLLMETCAPSVHPKTMAAIVRTESASRHLAINVNGGRRLVRQPASRDEAIATARWLISMGYSIDMGIGQINSKNLPRLNMSVEDAFDPCANLTGAANILQRDYTRALNKYGDEQTALRAAFSAYNTGTFSRGFSNGYVHRVVSNSNTSDRSIRIRMKPQSRLASAHPVSLTITGEK